MTVAVQAQVAVDGLQPGDIGMMDPARASELVGLVSVLEVGTFTAGNTYQPGTLAAGTDSNIYQALRITSEQPGPAAVSWQQVPDPPYPGPRMPDGATKISLAESLFELYSKLVTPWSAYRQALPTPAPVAPGSAQVAATLASQIAQDQYANLTMNFMPLVVVPQGQAEVPVAAGTSNLPGGTAPIPALAQTLVPSQPPPPATDQPLCMVRPSTAEAWEFWQADYYQGSWSSSDAGYEADATTAPGAMPSSYGLSASGLAYSGLMVTEADVARGSIDHAVALTVAWATYPPGSLYWPPAVRHDGGDSGGPEGPVEGMLLTWKPGTQMPAGMTPIAEMVFQAIATFGAYVTDVTTAGDANPNQGLAIQFEDTADWAAHGGTGTDPITAAMNGAAAYEAIAPLGDLLGDLQVVTPRACGTGGSVPAAPAVTVGTVGSSSVALSWAAVPGSVYYLVEFSTDGITWTLAGMGQSPAAWPTGTSCTVTGLVSSTAYQFRVSAMGANTATASGQLSPASAAVSATTTAAPVFSADSPPAAVVNAAYSYTFAASYSPTFSVASGSLPPGLSLSSSGVLSGTPTSIGSYQFAVTASSASEGTSTTTATITLDVTSALAAAVTPAVTGFGTLSPAFPTGWAAGDVCYALTSLQGGSPCQTPTGWTVVAGPDANQFTTTATFRRVLQAGDTPPTWTDPGGSSNQFDVGYVTVRNANTTTPEDVAPVHGTTYGGPPTLGVSSLTPATLGALVLYWLGGFITGGGTIDTATSEAAFTEGNAHEVAFYEKQTAIAASASEIDSSENQPVISYAVIAVRPA